MNYFINKLFIYEQLINPRRRSPTIFDRYSILLDILQLFFVLHATYQSYFIVEGKKMANTNLISSRNTSAGLLSVISAGMIYKVPEGHAGLVTSLGKYKRTKSSGLGLKSMWAKVSPVDIRNITEPKEIDVVTTDTKDTIIKYALTYAVVNPQLAVLTHQTPMVDMHAAIIGEFRDEAFKMSSDEIAGDKQRIPNSILSNEAFLKGIEERTGLRITALQVTEVIQPKAILDAQARIIAAQLKIKEETQLITAAEKTKERMIIEAKAKAESREIELAGEGQGFAKSKAAVLASMGDEIGKIVKAAKDAGSDVSFDSVMNFVGTTLQASVYEAAATGPNNTFFIPSASGSVSQNGVQGNVFSRDDMLQAVLAALQANERAPQAPAPTV
ncbi:MAG: hypothetical protein GC136_10015 [Alphaproteobacteria bacterium]|nr:hypothetical protein [Alphaproteobacteria bacterium]